jgi:hypothetical protein
MTMLSGPTAAVTELQILALRARGFQFVNPRDESGAVLAVVGVRAHHDVLDVIRLTSAQEAVASRVPIDAPTTDIWRESGPSHEVLDRLLALPDPCG